MLYEMTINVIKLLKLKCNKTLQCNESRLCSKERPL